ncbi:MAG: methyl-accepting chemotaxis protein, partial [Acidobacteriota bacterium]
SSPQAQERRSETAGVLADPRQAFELAPQRELAAIRNAGQRQEDALQQVAILSGMILLAGVSGAASLISAARILTCHLQHEISALQSLYKHTVKKTNRIFDKVGGVASAIGRVAVKLPPARGERRAAEWIDSATDAARALQSSVVEIGRVTEQIRGIAFKIGIPDLQTAVVSAGAGDQSADFGIVATEVKRLATDTATCAAEIRTQVRTLESHLAGVGARLRQLRETDAERDAVAPSLPRSLASEQEQLYKLAAAMEELCGKPAPDRSNIRWPKSTQNGASVLLQSVPGIWP